MNRQAEKKLMWAVAWPNGDFVDDSEPRIIYARKEDAVKHCEEFNRCAMGMITAHLEPVLVTTERAPADVLEWVKAHEGEPEQAIISGDSIDVQALPDGTFKRTTTRWYGNKARTTVEHLKENPHTMFLEMLDAVKEKD